MHWWWIFPIIWCYFLLGLIEKITCVRSGNKPLTSADLINLFVVDCHGESRSNASLQSEEATMFMECFIVDFVVDCHGENGSNARLQSEEATMFMECCNFPHHILWQLREIAATFYKLNKNIFQFDLHLRGIRSGAFYGIWLKRQECRPASCTAYMCGENHGRRIRGQDGQHLPDGLLLGEEGDALPFSDFAELVALQERTGSTMPAFYRRDKAVLSTVSYHWHLLGSCCDTYFRKMWTIEIIYFSYDDNMWSFYFRLRSHSLLGCSKPASSASWSIVRPTLATWKTKSSMSSLLMPNEGLCNAS